METIKAVDVKSSADEGSCKESLCDVFPECDWTDEEERRARKKYLLTQMPQTNSG